MKYPPHNPRRHRNPQKQDSKKQPFFTSNKTLVQTKEDPAFFQTKLEIGQPGDKYEQEADTVADAVVDQSNDNTPVVQQKEISGIQRMASPIEEEEPVQKQTEEEEEPVQMQVNEEEESVQMQEEEEEPLQMQAEEEEPVQMQVEEEEEPLQAKSNTNDQPGTSAQLSSKIHEQNGKGRSLPENTRSEMETSFGVDFSGVNIHTDTEAVQMNQDLGAQAFTQGQDVYFNSGKFQPETNKGKHLLAHELTHVVQQGKSKDKSEK